MMSPSGYTRHTPNAFAIGKKDASSERSMVRISTRLTRKMAAPTYQAGDLIKLASNENPFGPSPAAIAAYKAAGDDLASYPSPDCGDLRAAIGAQHGIDPARILCGNGSDELIALLCMAYAGEGQEVLFPDHSFALYGLAAQANGCTPTTRKRSSPPTPCKREPEARTRSSRLTNARCSSS